jgi:transposase InsO family protein
MLLKKKSEAFNAYAETHFGTKLKALQDDNGGEYMSKEFLKFTDSCGIERRHTTCNRPQYNGVAERANRTMSDDITAMLDESNLPASFWEYCLNAHMHV